MANSKFITFAEKHLGVKLWDMQRRIMMAVEKPHARVSVRKNNGCGGSFMAMVTALAFAATYPGALVLVLSPTWTQTLRVLMEQVKAFARAGSGREQLPIEKLNEDEIRIFDSKIFALGSNLMERLQGYHGLNVLIILDEASGIDPKLIPALEGISASGDVRWLALGNPTRASGWFYETHSPRNRTFKKFAISAFDTPNLRTPRQLLPGTRPFTIDELFAMTDAELDANPWPQLTSRRFVRDKYLDWYVGKQALWQQRILGNFADLRSEALFSVADLEACMRPSSADPHHRNFEVGIDPSVGGGDATGVTICSGNAIVACERIEAADSFEATIKFLRPYRDSIRLIYCDVIGLGAEWPRMLREHGYRVEGINVSGAPKAHDIKYANLKAERFVALAHRVRKRAISGMTPDLAQELGAIEQMSREGDGAVLIASKKEVKAKLGHSPDLAESLMVVLGGPDFAQRAQDARDALNLNSSFSSVRRDNLGEALNDPYAEMEDLGLNRTGAGIANRRVSRGPMRVGLVRNYGRRRGF
jgi:phage terminase large subunit